MLLLGRDLYALFSYLANLERFLGFSQDNMQKKGVVSWKTSTTMVCSARERKRYECLCTVSVRACLYFVFHTCLTS